jgi:hypothetical protein
MKSFLYAATAMLSLAIWGNQAEAHDYLYQSGSWRGYGVSGFHDLHYYGPVYSGSVSRYYGSSSHWSGYPSFHRYEYHPPVLNISRGGVQYIPGHYHWNAAPGCRRW